MMYANSSQSDGSDQVGCNPCNTLLLRGLDGLTTEENIQSSFTKLIAIPVTNCRVIRDKMTGVSNGFAFVEFGSVKDSKQVMQLLVNMENQLEVDGKALIVDYAKNTFYTAITTIESGCQPGGAQDSGTSLGQQASSEKVNNPDFSANQAAAVAQAAIMKSQSKKKVGHQTTATGAGLLGPYPNTATSGAVSTGAAVAYSTGAVEYPTYPVPDTSKFTYDASSGYYYDSSTGFYYDAKSQYFYNPMHQHFMYWDGEKQTYIPVANTAQTPADAQQAYANAAQSASDKKDNRPEQPEKGAKKIVKDMEKWAKKFNSQKEAQKMEMKKTSEQVKISAQQASSAPNIGYSLLEKSSKNNLELLNEAYSMNSAALDVPKDAASPLREAPVEHPQIPEPTQIQVPSSAASAPVEKFQTESDLFDWEKLMCKLCRRVFVSKEVLIKHQQFSDLHKKNLEDFLRSRGESNESQQYRDRARERREKFGEPEPPGNKRFKRDDPEPSYVPPERPTQDGIKEDNIGNKLLQKMGWKDGQGLGKGNQGIVEPIEATLRQAQAGLGSRGSSYNVDPSGSYKDRARNTFRAYFNEIN